MGADLVKEILKLKKEKNAVILAHYYQPGFVQELADYVGDSYYLSEVARDCTEETIMFCGVRFMAESAKILSPHKTVLMPCASAGCSMADMASGKALLELKEKYPEAYVVCYINSTANVKAHCDLAVTSSSALKILKNVPSKQIMFLPDRNLGEYISEFFPEKEFILWDGFCRCHNKISREDILKEKEKHKGAKVLVHPECTKEIRDIADYVGSTSGIIDYATKNDGNEFIIATEEGILHELKKKNPNKDFFIPGDKICCQDMKKTTLENLYDALLNGKNEMILNEDIRKKALKSLENMHILASEDAKDI
ncbi:quinolinate synthase NadA [Clostridium chromiireducens]|uniref:Quinolinate synthase n=1 Tax=Clostridium chromiireducens TaxID=225345 RepID=A0A1V4IT03_9CLOT|nr:quinolinate synthase NadA [Clostridium chromiireducens]OPJ63142.1 quinolinate synthase A [Clostridium chromiireducens]RII34671.1 quinolinate synthase NadA [Clostridium chromiireducens]